jgi:hypothetical protein
MPNTYRPTSDRAKALYGSDDVDLDLSATDEADALQGGHLALVPRPFKVLVNNYEAGEQGDVVDLALHVDQESALVSGGILERAEPKKPAAKKSAK